MDIDDVIDALPLLIVVALTCSTAYFYKEIRNAAYYERYYEFVKCWEYNYSPKCEDFLNGD